MQKVDLIYHNSSLYVNIYGVLNSTEKKELKNSITNITKKYFIKKIIINKE